MNLIQENTEDVEFFTSLRDIEKWLEISLEDYDWHFSDVDGAWMNSSKSQWLTGKQLNSKIKAYNYQFVWAVISAFPSGSPRRFSDLPFADGNPNFWRGSPKKRLEDSLFEIVCWDSSATLFIGLAEELGRRIYKNAPGIKDLDQKNKQPANKI